MWNNGCTKDNLTIFGPTLRLLGGPQVHRLGPLLAVGRAVLSEPGSDPSLDAEYEGELSHLEGRLSHLEGKLSHPCSTRSTRARPGIHPLVSLDEIATEYEYDRKPGIKRLRCTAK